MYRSYRIFDGISEDEIQKIRQEIVWKTQSYNEGDLFYSREAIVAELILKKLDKSIRRKEVKHNPTISEF